MPKLRWLDDREATQEFVVRDTLIRHTGKQLAPEIVDAIIAEFIEEIRRGPCAWAFQPEGPKS